MGMLWMEVSIGYTFEVRTRMVKQPGRRGGRFEGQNRVA